MRRLILGAPKDFVSHHGDLTVKDLPIQSVYHGEWEGGYEDMFTAIYAANVVEKVNSLVDFMDSAWLCLVNGGSLYIETPVAGGDANAEYADPTIVRCYRPNTFNFFTPEGVEIYGYTDKSWAIVNLVIEGSMIKVTMTPIK